MACSCRISFAVLWLWTGYHRLGRSHALCLSGSWSRLDELVHVRCQFPDCSGENSNGCLHVEDHLHDVLHGGRTAIGRHSWRWVQPALHGRCLPRNRMWGSKIGGPLGKGCGGWCSGSWGCRGAGLRTTAATSSMMGMRRRSHSRIIMAWR